MSQAYDDYIRRMMEMLEAHAAPGPADDTTASDSTGTGAPGPDGRPTRLALPLTMEQVQAVFSDAPEELQDWRSQARAGYGYAAPGALGSGTDRPWSPEQQATITYLRQVVAQMPAQLERWRSEQGLPSRISADEVEPWDVIARQTAATATAALVPLPPILPAPVSVLALPPGPAGADEQAPKQAEPSGQEDAAEE
jgi:hypothetical protein